MDLDLEEERDAMSLDEDDRDDDEAELDEMEGGHRTKRKLQPLRLIMIVSHNCHSSLSNIVLTSCDRLLSRVHQYT